MTSTPSEIAANAQANHKKIITRIHRVIDEYDRGLGATAAMVEIKRVLGRGE